MTQREHEKCILLKRIIAGEITQVFAASQLGMSDRQIRNLLRQFKEHGIPGVISKKRGRPSNRCFSAEKRSEVLRLVEKHYADYGPTLARERLEEKHGITVSRETLRKKYNKLSQSGSF